MTRVLISAGDASGDAHCAEVVEALRQRLPEARFFGMGGRALAAAGLDVVVDQRELAVGGQVEVLGCVGRALRSWRSLERAARAETTDLAILVDSPDFNLPLARRLRRSGIPILYYIAPQVWAWRTGRVRKLAARVQRMAVIFPFEVELFAAAGVRVDFVGHPLVERLQSFRSTHPRERARAALGLAPERPVLVLLPGSRHNEIESGLALFLECAAKLRQAEPALEVLLALASTVDADQVAPACAASGLPVRVVEGRTYELLMAADVALAKPGTVTVEVALLGCPLVVAGRAHPLTAAIMRRLVRVPSFTMPNLIAGGPVVPEFLQEDAVPDRIALALGELLRGPARDFQRARLEQMARRLGAGGAARNTARIAAEMIGDASAAG